jgi:ArsR family transcriptional regulator
MATRTRGCCVAVAPPLPDARADELAALFKALADPTRVQMLHMLKAATEPICVCDFTAAFDLGQPTISHHVARLKDAGLVSSFKRGVWSFYSLRGDLSATGKAALELVR